MVRMVTEYLDATAVKFPDKIAFTSNCDKLSFRDLRRTARQIATGLAERGIFHQPVAVFMEKSAACVSAFLGVAYSGNFYTPLDVKMPAARIEKILSTLQPAAIIVKAEHQAEAEAFANGTQVLCYEGLQATVDEARLADVASRLIDTDVLYVLFTSGSTGTPKGVIIGHRSVVDYTEWLADTFCFDEQTIFGNQAPFYFDNSVLDIYSTLRNGSTCVLIPEEKFVFPIRTMEYLQQQRVNTIFWVPSALCLVANLKALPKRHIDGLQKVLFCGEVMPNKQLNQWRHEYPEAMFANLYGPTEITDVCTAYIVDRDFADDEPLPIGRPCKNTGIIVLDEEDRLVTKSGQRGELCVRGTSLAYGYWRNHEKTAAVFLQNPLQDTYPEIIYRTGDIVEYNERGELVYVCRKDFQIKHMGHRIELGEIETVASAIEGVKQCACLYNVEQQRIVLFYSGDTVVENMKEVMRKQLPDYMLPGKIERLERLALNSNGKIDRKVLKGLL